MENNVVIISACRTPIGKMGGALRSVPVVDLGALVMQEVLRRANVSSSTVDEVIMGCVLQAGQGQNVARQAALKAGLPVEVPAQTLNVVCGSGLKAIQLGAAMIKAGEADIILAGGMENMSRAPFALADARFGYRLDNGTLFDTLVQDALWDSTNDYHMGITAENIARKYRITREMQDDYALQSQLKCEFARANRMFEEEIVPVSITEKGTESLFFKDEAPRSGMNMQKLSQLKPAFEQDGTVTAGNASGINDGAAAVLLMSERKACELGILPLAMIEGCACKGVDPAYMGLGPIASTKALLKQLHSDITIFNLIEVNEAFASQTLAVIQELGLDRKKTNINGGAIALGHPVGASGCRILVTLLYALKHANVHKGLATLCVGGGMGVSIAVRMLQ